MVIALLLVFIACGANLFAAEPPFPPPITNAFRISGVPHSVNAVGVDAAGNTYLSGGYFGAFPSNGFPVLNKTTIGPAHGAPNLYVAKFSPSGDKLLYLTEISDTDALYDHFGGMVVLSDGSVLLAGGTRAQDFPTTEHTYQPHALKGGAFLLKLDRSGQKLVFSTFLDNSPNTAANALGIGPDGSIYVAGATDGRTFPTTDGAYQRNLPPGSDSVGFVSRISADGSQLLYSTLFTGGPIYNVAVDNMTAIHLATYVSLTVLDGSGSRVIFSKSFNTALAVQIDGAGNSYAYRTGVLTKFDQSGAVLFERQVPAVLLPQFGSFTVLDDASVVLAGWTPYVNFQTRNSLQACNMNLLHDTLPVQWWVLSAALVVLDQSGNLVNASFLGGHAPPGYGNDGSGFYASAKGVNGAVVLAGSSASVTFPGGPLLIPGDPSRASFAFTLDLGALSHGWQPVPACLALSATQAERAVEAPVVPAMFMSLFGSGLGPVPGVYAQLDSTQRLPTELAGVSLTVGGIAAPILFVQDGQIDFIAPHDITGPTTEVCVSRNGTQSCLFTYVGDQDGTILPGILNEDGTVNSSASPAVGGSVVSVFGIGLGIFDPTIADGALTSNALASSRYSVIASFQQTSGKITAVARAGALYVGTAPNLLNGVAQINVPVWKLSGMAIINFQVIGGTIPAYPLRIPPVAVFVK